MADYGTGIACPACGKVENGVKDSRANKSDTSIRRRRRCVCGERFTTVEVVVTGHRALLEHSHGHGWLATPVAQIERTITERIRRRLLEVLE